MMIMDREKRDFAGAGIIVILLLIQVLLPIQAYASDGENAIRAYRNFLTSDEPLPMNPHYGILPERESVKANDPDIGFFAMDLDGDGISELLVADLYDDYLNIPTNLWIYSFSDEKMVLLFQYRHSAEPVTVYTGNPCIIRNTHSVMDYAYDYLYAFSNGQTFYTLKWDNVWDVDYLWQSTCTESIFGQESSIPFEEYELKRQEILRNAGGELKLYSGLFHSINESNLDAYLPIPASG